MNRKSVTKRTTLNDTLLLSLDTELKDYRFFIEDKLYLFVKNTGRKYWQVQYKKVNGKWSFKSLGVFPTVNMKQASERADSFFEQLRKDNFSFGKNTQSNKYKLMTLIESWIEIAKVNWCKKVFISVIGAFKKHVYPLFGECDFRSITAQKWLSFFQGLFENGLPSVMDKIYGFVNSAYTWAAIEYNFHANPLPAIKRFMPKYKKQEFKRIDITELDQFLKDIRAYPDQAISIGLELVLLLFPRGFVA